MEGGLDEVGEARRTFVPAAGHDWLLPLYDPLLKLLGGESSRRELVDQAAIRPKHRVLDIGCGTGSLAVMIKRLHPDAEIIGLDPDPKALARGRRKAEAARISVRFEEGFSDELPHPDASFDRVFSSFMLHHLQPDEKEKTLREVRRVLRPGGSLHLLDFGSPGTRAHGLLARLLHSSEPLRDNLEGRVPALMREAGFGTASEVSHRRTVFGPIAYYRAA
jgi:ubiquinone/menaquinone biosynthesis C-methylase UbiE